MYKILPLMKTHYSLGGRSILTLDAPWDEKSKKPKPVYKNSVFDLLREKGLDTLVLVEDTLNGLLQASKQSKEHKFKLVFGLRLDVCEDMDVKDDASFLKRAKYIVFAKSLKGYKALIKIWSEASSRGFYYTPNIDFKTLKKLWTKDLSLVVPFYDSFLFLNSLNSHTHVTSFDFTTPTFLLEHNNLPFDDLMNEKVKVYCQDNKFSMLPAQSIFYPANEDFEAYLAFRCVHNRGFNGKSSFDKPELEHMHSPHFNFDKWYHNNQA
jgi:DNA polymerase III alpha subunit